LRLSRVASLIAPTRRWRLVAVNVTKTELEHVRPYVQSLITPRDDAMNVNIATALWFAARGIGTLVEPRPDETEAELLRRACSSPDSAAFTSPARILVVGIGADEQLAGYVCVRKGIARSQSTRSGTRGTDGASSTRAGPACRPSWRWRWTASGCATSVHTVLETGIRN
jgi:asparagine synthetase B (glutamine-hydrolysing)